MNTPGQQATLKAAMTKKVVFAQDLKSIDEEHETIKKEYIKYWSLAVRLLFIYGFVFRAYGIFLRWSIYLQSLISGAKANEYLKKQQVFFAADLLSFLFAFISFILVGQDREALCKQGYLVIAFSTFDLCLWSGSFYLHDGPFHYTILYLPLNVCGVIIFLKILKR